MAQAAASQLQFPLLLFKSKPSKGTPKLVSSSFNCSARVLSYKNIIKVQKRRDINEVGLRQRRFNSTQSNTYTSYR